jgi:predicted methyltransferase
VHDPPARALCRTDLYGLQFYKQLRRVLRPGGQLFHYIGSPDSKESGRLYSGITVRLKEAGFTNVKKAPRAFGLTATASLTLERNSSDHPPFSSTSSGETESSEY